MYAVAFRTAAVAGILQTATAAVVTPRLAGLHWSNERDELTETLNAAVRWTVVPSVAATIGLVALAPLILSIFGPEFGDGVAALDVYAIGQLVSVCAGPVGWLLSVAGEHRRAATIGVSSAGLTVVGYLVLIPTVGIVGAAIANSGGLIVKNIWSNMAVRRRLGYRVSVIAAFRPTRRVTHG